MSIPGGNPTVSAELAAKRWFVEPATPSSRWPTAAPFVRPAALAALLAGETLALTVRFDSGTLQQVGGVAARAIQWTPVLLQLAIATGAGAVLIQWRRLGLNWQEFAAASSRHASWFAWTCLHLLAFVGLLLSSSLVFEPPAVGLRAVDVVLWGTTLVAVAGTWLGALAPWSFWKRFLLRERTALLGGLCAGLAVLSLGRAARLLWEPLSDWTLAVVACLLRMTGAPISVEYAERIIGIGGFRVQIAPQCSGYEGMGLMAVFLGMFFLLFRNRLRFPRAWALWPIGLVAIWICNAMRIAALILIGATISPEIALGGFHSQAGWIFFNIAALSIAVLALRSPWFAHDSVSTVPATVKSHQTEACPVIGYLAPFLTLIAANMLAAAFSVSFDWSYPLKVLATATALILCRKTLRTINWTVSWQGAVIGVATFGIWMLLVDLKGESSGPPAELAALPAVWAWGWIAFRILGSVITVPIVEELAFRGFLMRRLTSERFEDIAYNVVPWIPIVVSSLLFGLLHGQWIAGTTAGVAFAFATRRRNSLGDAVFAHAVANALIAATVLLFGEWGLW